MDWAKANAAAWSWSSGMIIGKGLYPAAVTTLDFFKMIALQNLRNLLANPAHNGYLRDDSN
jgi:hypothetical protein